MTHQLNSRENYDIYSKKKKKNQADDGTIVNEPQLLYDIAHRDNAERERFFFGL